MTDWRVVRSLAKLGDSCDGCDSAVLERVPGADHHLCGHPRVLRAFGRERIAAAVAFADVCFGKWHPKARAA